MGENQDNHMNNSGSSDLFSQSAFDELDLWNTTLRETDLDRMLNDCLQKAENEVKQQENEENTPKTSKSTNKKLRGTKNTAPSSSNAEDETVALTPEEEVIRLKQEIVDLNEKMRKQNKARQEQLKYLRNLAAKQKQDTEKVVKDALQKCSKQRNRSGGDAAEIQQLKSQIVNLTAELDDTKLKLNSQQEQASQKSNEDLQSSMREKLEAKKDLNDTRSIIKALQQQEREQNEEIENLEALLKQTRDENEYLSQRMYDERMGRRQKKSQEETQPQTQENSNIKALQWANSNGGRILNKLKTNDYDIEWESVTNIFKTKHLNEKNRGLNLKENQDKKSSADVMTVMMGINELRGGYTAERAAKYYEEDIKPLIYSKKPVLLVQLPPVTDLVLKEEVKTLNNILKEMADKYPNTRFVETWHKLQDIPQDKIFEADGYHYDREKKGAEVVAEIINQKVNEVHEEMNKAQTTKVITIAAGSAPYYIGKGGEKIKEMQKQFSVNIQIPPEQNKIIVKGTRINIEHTEREIKNITENLNTQQERKALSVCFYYKRGNCWNGDNCEYSHEENDRYKR